MSGLGEQAVFVASTKNIETAPRIRSNVTLHEVNKPIGFILTVSSCFPNIHARS